MKRKGNRLSRKRESKIETTALRHKLRIPGMSITTLKCQTSFGTIPRSFGAIHRVQDTRVSKIIIRGREFVGDSSVAKIFNN